jgi:hypothetical protein
MDSSMELGRVSVCGRFPDRFPSLERTLDAPLLASWFHRDSSTLPHVWIAAAKSLGLGRHLAPICIAFYKLARGF